MASLNADQIVEQIEQLSAVDLARLQRLIIDKGVSRSLLAEIFHRAMRTVEERTRGLKPKSFRAKNPQYDLGEAAAVLVDPKIDIAEWVKSLRPNDLPTYLQSEFWKAQRNRQQYEAEAGEMWRTERVQAVLVDVAKTIAQQIKLMTDNVDQQATLSQAQREIVQNLCDSLLASIGEALMEYAAGYDSFDQDMLLKEMADAPRVVMKPADLDATFDPEGSGL